MTRDVHSVDGSHPLDAKILRMSQALGSSCCLHEEIACLAIEHTQKKVRNEIKRNCVLMSSWIQLDLQPHYTLNTQLLKW